MAAFDKCGNLAEAKKLEKSGRIYSNPDDYLDLPACFLEKFCSLLAVCKSCL